MKETNMEHYRGEIGRIIEELPVLNVKIAVVNGEPKPCYKVGACKDCEFKSEPICFLAFIDWLMSEYKPEPVLTAREKGFVECIGDGWITRCEKGLLRWSEDEPEKQEEKGRWLIDFDFENVTLGNNLFPFITWEDEEAWAVADLRKLKVGDTNV